MPPDHRPLPALNGLAILKNTPPVPNFPPFRQGFRSPHKHWLQPKTQNVRFGGGLVCAGSLALVRGLIYNATLKICTVKMDC